MSPVDFSIQQIVSGVNDIPEYILKLAFSNPNNSYGSVWGAQNTEYSIEQGIREKVIIPMVAPLLNVAGGVTDIIDLSGARIENLQAGIIHVNIPDYLTGGRKLISVLEVYPGNLNRAIASGYNMSRGTSCGTGGQVGNALNRLMTGLDDSNVQRVFTRFTMIGNNSFIIRDAGAAMFNMIAKVILSYDEHFSVIPPKMYDKFSELVELGVKAYIYKTCKRGMQEAVSRYGVSVDDVRDDVEKYADSAKEFKEFFNEEMKKHLSYSDPKGVTDTLSMMIPRKR